MNVLVVGAKGQVGQEIMLVGPALFAAAGLDVNLIGYDRQQLDITNENDIETKLLDLKPSVVINASAYTAVDKAETDADTAYAVNANGPKLLAATCQKVGSLLIHISTDYVFDGEQEGAYREDDKANPSGVYGLSKYMGEQGIQACLARHYIVRVAWVFGALGNNFVKTMLKLGNEREALSVVGDQIGAPTWAKDIATVLIQMATGYLASDIEQRKALPYGLYHYTGKKTVSWFEFAQTIFKKSNKLGLVASPPTLSEITTKDYPTPAKRPANSQLNCSKIKQHFNIECSDWDHGLDDVLNQWKVK